ncbi:Arm DNA-binding domain-containing protein [Pedobacter sp. UYP1]|uniref:Arm DNA-binding domain-containing protein n=1 Tax=Pedobacter sp. UYP1 TaxID=1756396 RepID=UPI0033957E33
MKSTHTFSVSFFLKKDKAKNGKAPLFARITVDGAFTDISTKQRVYTSTWNQGKQTLSGNGAEELMVREKMRLLVNNLNNAYNDLRHENKAVNAELIKARVEGRDKDLCSLNFLMNYHNVELASC